MVEGPKLQTQGSEPSPTTPVKRVHHPPPAPPESQQTSQSYNGVKNLTSQLDAEQYDESPQQYEYDENGVAMDFQSEEYGEDTPLQFGAANISVGLGYGDQNADAPLAFNAKPQTPFINTGMYQF